MHSTFLAITQGDIEIQQKTTIIVPASEDDIETPIVNLRRRHAREAPT